MTWSPDEDVEPHQSCYYRTLWSTKVRQRLVGHWSHHGHEEDLGSTEVNGTRRKSVADANTMAAQQGLDAVRAALEREAPHLLEKRETKARREGLPDLENAENGKVVLRFAPNPNGPLSFGHARGLVINSTYRAMYEGEFILRFDDTDTKVKPPMLEAYERIQEETAWLIGRQPDQWSSHQTESTSITNTPPRCWRAGLDHLQMPQMSSKNTVLRRPTVLPNQTPEDNAVFWKRMLKGAYKPGLGRYPSKDRHDVEESCTQRLACSPTQDTNLHPHHGQKRSNHHVAAA